MSAATSKWPACAVVRAAGYRFANANDVERTEWDDGALRQARIYTRARLVRRVVAEVPGGRLGDFRTWAQQWAHRPFSWRDPHDGVIRKARVAGGAGGIEYRQIAVRAGAARWEITCELEGEE